MRTDPKRYAERFSIARDHAALTQTTTIKVYKVPTGRKLRLDRATYLNVTGLARSDTDSFVVEIRNGATVVATLSNTGTVVSGGAALAANTFVEGVKTATDSDLVFEADEELTFVATETGTATLPAGSYIVEGRLF